MKRFVWVIGLAILFAASCALAHPKTKSGLKSDAARGFTIQQALSAPFPAELTAAPAGNRFAWVFNDQGKRNVWVAQPASSGKGFQAFPITKYTQDDGQDVGNLAWTPDGSAVVYVRGGDLENIGTPDPNPASFVAGVEQDVWIASVEGGEPRKIGQGRAPAVSPKGDVVAYILKDQVWLATLDGSEKPAQLIHARGKSSSLRWSPDGRYLAFVSDRGDHSFIAVYEMGAESLEFLDPSTDHDQEPVWSPDGKRVAFQRIPSSKRDIIFEAKRSGPPWSIRVGDVATGKSTEIWKALPGDGSLFRNIEAANQLMWGAGDSVVFPWEADGWTHLYAVAASCGGHARLLTPGDFEVEYATMSRDGKFVAYSSNQNDIDLRHVWKVGINGDAPPQPMTSGTGIETDPAVSSDSQSIAVLRSDARMPLRPAILEGGEIRDLAANQIPADFPAAQLVTPRQVIFPAADGLVLHGQIFLPANAGDGTKHPAVVFFHGGSQRQMLLGWHYMDYYSNAYAMNQYLASRGYIVLSVNYRSGIGYGLDFREALNYGASGASEYNDVQGAGLYLRGRKDVDARRIGAWGGSYGGYLTALALARASDLYAAGVDFHGVHNWNLEITQWIPAYDPDSQPDDARLAWNSSPMAFIKTWRSPVLLIQGDDDRNVPFAETVDLAEALRKQGVPYQELIFPDEIHDFLMHKTWIAAYTAAAEFLDQHLGARPAGEATTGGR
ncbi:MAG: S9 family peptidase [Candidatus Acidiferrales bacterium]